MNRYLVCLLILFFALASLCAAGAALFDRWSLRADPWRRLSPADEQRYQDQSR